MSSVTDEFGLIPEAPPPEASQLGAVVWARKNLFNSPLNALITVVMVGVLGAGAVALSSFIFADERRWDAITDNMRLLMVEGYPVEHIFRIWVSIGLLFLLIGLTVAIWNVGGKLAPESIQRMLIGAGGLVAGLGLFGQPDTWVTLVVVGGVLIVGALVWRGRIGKRSMDRTIPTLAFLGVVIGLLTVVIWLLPIARTTQVPWTVEFAVLIGSYLLGRLVVRAIDPQRIKRFIIAGWLLSFPYVYLVLQRRVDLDLTPLLTWVLPAGFLVAGAIVLWLQLDRLPRDASGIIVSVLAVLSVAALIVPVAWDGWADLPVIGPLQGRVLLFALTAFAAGGRTFASGEKGLRNVLVAWAGTVVAIAYMGTVIRGATNLGSFNAVFGGLNLTLLLSVAAITLSFPIGVLMALARTSKMPIFRLLSTGYIELVRGVPLITVIFFANRVLPRFLPPELAIDKVVAVAAGMTFFAAAYLAENVRGGLQAIPKGQVEAAQAVGMSTFLTTSLITLPQALRTVIPALVGSMIALFKDTSLVTIIGLADFLHVARSIIPSQPEFLGVLREPLLFAALVYWLFTFTFSRASLRLEQRLGVGDR
jgi:His/Glu/Gln/Arg/opine family amino acid ABC transporter permease subunit